MAEFFSQGGYGFYVWTSYGVGFALMAMEIFQLRRHQRTIWRRVGRLTRMRSEVKHESQT